MQKMPPNSVVVRFITTFIVFISVHLSAYAQVHTTGIAKLDSWISTGLLILKILIVSTIILLGTNIYKESKFGLGREQHHKIYAMLILIVFLFVV